MLKWVSLLYFILNFTGNCLAESKLAEGTGVGLGYYVRLLLSLGFILAIIYIAGQVFRVKLSQKDNNKVMKVVERLCLEQGVSLYIIKAWDDMWVVGVGNKDIKIIEKIGESSLNLKNNDSVVVSTSFMDRIKNVIVKSKRV